MPHADKTNVKHVWKARPRRDHRHDEEGLVRRLACASSLAGRDNNVPEPNTTPHRRSPKHDWQRMPPLGQDVSKDGRGWEREYWLGAGCTRSFVCACEDVVDEWRGYIAPPAALGICQKKAGWREEPRFDSLTRVCVRPPRCPQPRRSRWHDRITRYQLENRRSCTSSVAHTSSTTG
jgi:hypothetical protein